MTHPAGVSRGDVSLVGRGGEQPALLGLRPADAARPRMRRAGPGTRAALSVLPALTDVWTDGTNWRLGHWLTGRLGAVSLAASCGTSACGRAARSPDRRHRPLGRGRGLRHHRAGKPARLDHHAVAPLRLRRGGDRGRDPLRHARPGLRRHPRARRSGRRPRGRRAGADARPGDRTAAGAEMAGRARRRGLRRGPRRGAAHHRGHDPDRLRDPSRWRCRPRRPSAAAAAR